ncbi:Methyl-viologen-reducing hydrogenase, delta subunit [Candidatus Electrothrix marina]|uniref:Methyl-viologen-reducing hydrogenase, delta subunit n=1 Tax=Candidatus Electrothrix marina TaxID=1859130 RepID=A0A3S3RWZ4_9BACT|nr:Methyl-viologen-reducing hydrogenase, delta subunit [Candidatus Electrothrix marina]RWX51597.1 Methyl-viologen-reducing hydrogenase, delta subunit [Candidatus Electrothrix marina]
MGVDALVRKVLEDVGIRKERYDLQWASAAEAPRFVQLITGFTERMKELGPLGEAEGLSQEEIKAKLEKALAVVSDQKVRVSFGNAAKAVRKDAVWTPEHIDEVVTTKMAKTLDKALA